MLLLIVNAIPPKWPLESNRPYPVVSRYRIISFSAAINQLPLSLVACNNQTLISGFFYLIEDFFVHAKR